MLDMTKFHDFFQPEKVEDPIHIIGCGAIGSTVAASLARAGLKKMVLYDFDTVDAHNIANQMFTSEDIGRPKVVALADYLVKINPDITGHLRLAEKGYTGQKLSGYIFLCVDDIDLRRQIAESCVGNRYVKAVFDFRMRLTDAQHYAARWDDRKAVQAFLNSMAFSHEEAAKETPVSACNMTLSIAPTVQLIVAHGVSNFINFCKTGSLKKMILADAFTHIVDAF